METVRMSAPQVLFNKAGPGAEADQRVTALRLAKPKVEENG